MSMEWSFFESAEGSIQSRDGGVETGWFVIVWESEEAYGKGPLKNPHGESGRVRVSRRGLSLDGPRGRA